jgi:Family of unknown function (DUF5989)
MSDNNLRQSESAAKFADQAKQRQTNLASEVFAFLRHTKKWWLAPAIVMLALLGFLIVLGGSSVAPFIYTLF